MTTILTFRVDYMETNMVNEYDVRNRFIMYYYRSKVIWSTVEAYFADDKLRIDGCDSGEIVDSHWGADTDYEYWMTLPPESVEKLYKVLGAKDNDRKNLLRALTKHAHGTDCFTKCREFFKANEIDYEYMCWS